MALRWALHAGGVRLEADGAVVSHAREGPDAAASTLLLEHGRHRITLEIVRSERNRGFMYLGVLAADGRTGSWPEGPKQDASNGKYSGKPVVGWGFCPLNGHLHSTATPSEWGLRLRKLMSGDLSGRAEGAIVVLIVDMDRRKLSFSIDGHEPVDAKVHLPAAVRPWVVLAHREDAVRLAGYRGPALVRTASAADEWLRLVVPPTLKEYERAARAAKDTVATGLSKAWVAMGREGLVTEALLAEINSSYEVSTGGGGLLAQLLLMGVATPLPLRVASDLLPVTATHLLEEGEEAYLLPCILPDHGDPADPALHMDPSSPFTCTLVFRLVAADPRLSGIGHGKSTRGEWNRAEPSRVKSNRVEATARSITACRVQGTCCRPLYGHASSAAPWHSRSLSHCPRHPLRASPPRGPASPWGRRPSSFAASPIAPSSSRFGLTSRRPSPKPSAASPHSPHEMRGVAAMGADPDPLGLCSWCWLPHCWLLASAD